MTWMRYLAMTGLALAGPLDEAQSQTAQLTGDAVVRPEPVEVEAVPGKLKVRVQATDCGTVQGPPMPCWLYTTHGFSAFGQQEIGLAVLRRGASPHAFSHDPVKLFAAILPLAMKGQFVSVGGRTSFGPASFLGRTDIQALLYREVFPLRSLALQPDALVAIPVTRDEYEAAERFGQLRVLALLGAQARLYPWPEYFDPERKPVVPAGGFPDSIMNKMGRLRGQGPRVRMVAPAGKSATTITGDLVVSFPIQRRAELEDAIVKHGHENAVAVLAEMDPDADGLFVYRPDAPPSAIQIGTEPTRSLAGAFVTFVPVADTDATRQVEDGFAVMLGPQSWAALVQAFAEGSDLDLPSNNQGCLPVHLRWRD